MMRETNRATAASMKTYMLASFTAALLVLSTALDLTKALWRYKLCGMITAPMIPTAWSRDLLSVISGMARPLTTSHWSGWAVPYS